MSIKRIARVVRNVKPHWVGDGFPVRSLFSYHENAAEFDPFLLLDYAGPAAFEPTGRQRGVGEHPHRGFETVTIVYAGQVEHRDSAGNRGVIGPGDVQWMTAAAGVVHEEFHGQAFSQQGGTLEMVQLWVNLPAKDKMAPPRYQELTKERIPTVALPDEAGSLRVIAGEFAGKQGPGQTFTPLHVWDVRLAAGHAATLEVPEGDTALAVVQRGVVGFGGEDGVQVGELAVFDRSGTTIEIAANEDDARLLILVGQPIREPVVGHGPFVMNTREEIQQAFADYRLGKMGSLA